MGDEYPVTGRARGGIGGTFGSLGDVIGGVSDIDVLVGKNNRAILKPDC
jgi:hypothetical protein